MTVSKAWSPNEKSPGGKGLHNLIYPVNHDFRSRLLFDFLGEKGLMTEVANNAFLLHGPNPLPVVKKKCKKKYNQPVQISY